MEFVITCPIDGPVEVSLEDVDTVVLREPEEAEIIFTCPECGSEISVMVRIPSFLMAAIEAMAEDGGGHMAPLASVMAMAMEMEEGSESNDAPVELAEDDAFDAYCEYFRRQLDSVDTVDDILREMGRIEE